MSQTSVAALIAAALQANLIDMHSIDQDGANVIVIGETIRYLSDTEAVDFLDQLLRDGGVFPGKDQGSAPEA